ncbi:G-protein coupled receptor 157-like [Littorina saxatilis]|uniref:G-protein coupled receptor 157-like n=1 Tax=Littorina saxatilis TaxID=31220 RepID=UPI0038B516B7
MTSSPAHPKSVMDMVFVVVVSVTSFLSVPSCVIIIAIHVKCRDLRTTGRSMLVQLSVADLLTAVGNLMGVLWFLFSSLTIFSSIASFFWTTVTALSLFLVLVRHTHNTVHTHWKPIWLLCWGVPTIITAAALGFEVLGYDPKITQASWCWIDPKTPHQPVWNFMTGKAWELLAYFLTIVFYTAVRISLLRHKAISDNVLSHRPRRDGIRDANIKLMFVPLVFIVLRLWGTVRFLLGLVDYTAANSPYAAWIAPLQGFGDTAQGFCNFVMDVIFSPQFRRRLFCRTSDPPATSSSSNCRTTSISTVSGQHEC